MSCPCRGQCQPHEPPPQAVPPAGPGWPKRCPSPKKISPCGRGIGSPGPFQLFILVPSLGKETLMGPMMIPGGGGHAWCHVLESKAEQPGASNVSLRSRLWGAPLFIGKRNDPSPGGAGLLQAVFWGGVFFGSVTFPVTVCPLLPSPCPHPPRAGSVLQRTDGQTLFILVRSAAALHSFEGPEASPHRA